jgi:pyruvate formate lyase activating enzyme
LCSLPDFPIKGFIETSFIDWKGRLASVIFTGGCNFRCPFCHNRALVLTPQALHEVPLDHVMGRLRKFRHWVEGVVITGGEPTIQRGLPGLVCMLKEAGLMVKLDTNGSHPEVIKSLLSNDMIDYIAMDIKGPLKEYSRWAGITVDTEKIRESIDLIIEAPVDHEFRMTVVPFLHKEDDVYDAAEEIKGAKRFFLQDFIARDSLINPKFASIKPFSPERIQNMRETVRKVVDDNAPIYNHLR